MHRPLLQTPRLELRPLTIEHLAEFHRVGGQPEVAAMTRMPHPLDLPTARKVLEEIIDANHRGERISYAVHRRDTGGFIGHVRLRLYPEANRGDLAYWFDRGAWGQGFATEAAAALVRFGFTTLKLHRITADHLAGNGASGRVMQKLGMTREATLRQHALQGGVYHDLVLYGLLRSEWREPPAHR